MKDRVYAVVSKVMEVPVESLTDESSGDTIEAWDSLKHMNLVLALEEEFGVQFAPEQIIELLNVGLISMTVQELLGKE